ncbi:MAG: hypothetical protein FWB78_03605 [Treponema sp.]|nr:hypothetical protein [Treponema sp.]
MSINARESISPHIMDHFALNMAMEPAWEIKILNWELSPTQGNIKELYALVTFGRFGVDGKPIEKTDTFNMSINVSQDALARSSNPRQLLYLLMECLIMAEDTPKGTIDCIDTVDEVWKRAWKNITEDKMDIILGRCTGEVKQNGI